MKSVGLFVTVCLVAASVVFADDSLLDGEKRAPLIEESYIGHDLHNDYFYFEDKLVDEAYKRSKYTGFKTTLGGQGPDQTGQVVKKSAFPFAIAQRASNGMGVSSDRWDVKEDGHGNEYFAIYHATKSNFVANKLRGHLLRRIVNAVQDYLPVLDKTSQIDGSEFSKDDAEVLTVVKDNIEQIITKVCTEVAQSIRMSMKDSDSSDSSATIAILTKKNIIIVSAGEGRVIGYDDRSKALVLTNKNLKDVRTLSSPYIRFVQRVAKVSEEDPEDVDDDEDEDDTREIQFIVIESPQDAALLADNKAVEIFVRNVNELKHDPKHEQDMYANSVRSIVTLAENNLNGFKRQFNPDHVVMLVGLETDYRNIH